MHKKFLRKTFLLFWLTYAVFVNPIPTSISIVILQTTINVVDQQSLVISSWISPDVIEVGDKRYSSYAPASWIFPLPYYLVLKAAGDDLPSKVPDIRSPNLEKPDKIFYLHLLLVWFLLCPLSAFLLVQIERFVLKQGASELNAFCLAGLVGYGTLMFNYTELYLVRFFACLIIFNTVFWHLNTGTKKPPPFGLTGALFGLAICVDYSSALLVVLSSVFILRNSAKGEIFKFGIGLLVMLTALGCYHFLLYKNPFLTPYHFRVIRKYAMAIPYKGQIHYTNEYQQGILLGSGLPNLKIMLILLFSSFKGIFVYCPILLVGLWGHVIGLKKKIWPSMSIYALGLFVAYLLIVSGLKGELYWSGWPAAFGPRYLLATIPFMTLGIMHIQWDKLSVIIVSMFAAFSIFFNLLGAMLQDVLWKADIDAPLVLDPLRHGFVYIMQNGPRIPLLANYDVDPIIQYVLFFGLMFVWAFILFDLYLDKTRTASR